MKKLLITRRLPDKVADAAGARLAVMLRDFDLIIPSLNGHFQAAVFADMPELRAGIPASFGAGDTHINVEAAPAAGLPVSNAPGAVTDAKADFALTLIRMTSRRAGERAGRRTGGKSTQMMGQLVTGKRVGVIGMGLMAQDNLIALAKARALPNPV